MFVKYWVGIYGPYGLHDSSWRENYGSDYYVIGGSHGCVNTPESAMKTIFDNINVGDPVLVFGKNQWYDTRKKKPVKFDFTGFSIYILSAVYCNFSRRSSDGEIPVFCAQLLTE